MGFNSGFKGLITRLYHLMSILPLFFFFFIFSHTPPTNLFRICVGDSGGCGFLVAVVIVACPCGIILEFVCMKNSA